jgi:hypothetical protein
MTKGGNETAGSKVPRLHDINAIKYLLRGCLARLQRSPAKRGAAGRLRPWSCRWSLGRLPLGRWSHKNVTLTGPASLHSFASSAGAPVKDRASEARGGGAAPMQARREEAGWGRRRKRVEVPTKGGARREEAGWGRATGGGGRSWQRGGAGEDARWRRRGGEQAPAAEAGRRPCSHARMDR